MCIAYNYNTIMVTGIYNKVTGGPRGLGGVVVEFLPPTSKAAGSNLGPGVSCWKIGSYLPMPGGLQCSMYWFPPPVSKLPMQ